MTSKLRYIVRFIKSAISASGADLKTANELSALGKKCIELLQYCGREDVETAHFHSCIARVLGVFTMALSYHESIVSLSLAGQALNSSILLRTQLEAHLILCYLTNPGDRIADIEKRVHEYEDWVCIRMYQNSKKSKDFGLFTLNPQHAPYLKEVEENYLSVKAKYSGNMDAFNLLERSQSFLKDKREVAKQNDLEDLYLGVFAETSATVHLADISDRMIREETEGFDGYRYELGSKTEAMMMVGVSNIILLHSITRYLDVLQIPKELQRNLFRKVTLAKREIEQEISLEKS